MADDFDEEEVELDDAAEADDDLVLDDTDDDADDLVVDLDVDDELAVLEEVPVEVDATPKGATTSDGTDDEDDENLDLEDELHPDDVEEPLDVLLAERTAAERIDEDEADLEDEDLETEISPDGSGRIVPRRDDEFLCRSCFLVKPLSQLAKGEKDLCRDCE